MNTFKKKSLHAAVLAGLCAIGVVGEARFIEGAPPPRASLIPDDGIILADFKEARTTEIYALIELVRGALKEVIQSTRPVGDRWVNIKALYPDVAIVAGENGRHMAYPYSVNEANLVTIGVPQEVVEEFKPVAMREAAAFIEAVEGAQDKFLIRVIQSGLSLNRNFYSDEALREAVPLFEGVRVFNKTDEEHIKGVAKSTDKLLGGLSRAHFVEGKTPNTGEVRATLTLLNADDPVAPKLRGAIEKGMTHLFGFSVDMLGKNTKRMVEAVPVRYLVRATKVASVDLIVEPGAGGALVRMVEAADPEQHTEKPDMLRALMIKKIKAKLAADRIAQLGNLETCSDERLAEAYDEATALENVPAQAPPAGGITEDRLTEALAVVQARNYASQAIAASSLPAPAQTRLVESFNARTAFTQADVDAAIKSEADYLGLITKTGRVAMPGFGGGARITESAFEKAGDMLDAFFDPAHKNHRDVRSFKECYVAITGDRYVSGQLRDADKGRMAESLGAFRESIDSTTLADALGDSITRRMQALVMGNVVLNDWRKVAVVGSANDFRTQERFRVGGYGNLPAVAQAGAYAALSSPGDEKATYAVSKRGGTEDFTLEAIKNDDVGALRRIPQELALAAGNTLYEFVFDFYRTNPAIYDALALYHATHANLLTAALDATQFSAHRLLMAKQTRAGSLKRLGTAIKTLLVPWELQETAVNLFNRNTNLDKTYVQTLTPDIIVPAYWTDANDWCTVADPSVLPVVEIAFLDGKEEPELFVQDMPNVGSMFSNDKLTYKIRHIYGGGVLVDGFKGTTKAVVA